MRCPACSTELRKHEVAGVELDACPGCGGVWLDRGELERLLEAEDRARLNGALPLDAGPDSGLAAPAQTSPGPGPVTYRRCPRCDGWMARRNHKHVSGVVVDVCAKHGLWLDGGEYERIREFEERGDGERRRTRFEESERAHLADVERETRRYARETAALVGSRGIDFIGLGLDNLL